MQTHSVADTLHVVQNGFYNACVTSNSVKYVTLAQLEKEIQRVRVLQDMYESREEVVPDTSGLVSVLEEISLEARPKFAPDEQDSFFEVKIRSVVMKRVQEAPLSLQKRLGLAENDAKVFA